MLQIHWPIKYNPSEWKCGTQKKNNTQKKPLNPNHWIYDSTYVSICRYIVKFDHKTYDNNIDHLYSYHTDYIDKGSRIY